MTHELARYIQARPVHEARVALGSTAFYHGRYRGFAAETHAHDVLQILIPLAGRMHVRAGAQDHLIGPDWGVIIGSDVPHAFTHLDGALDFLAIDVPPDTLLDLASGLPLPPRDLIVTRNVGLWLQAQQLAAEVDDPGEGHAHVLRSGLIQLGIYLLRATSPSLALPPPPGSHVLRAVDRILRDYAEDLSIQDLAREVAMSPRHFERSFKQALGQTPKRFLIDVRLAAACDLLESSDLAISTIALEVGFKTHAHFAETFQRLHHQTPRSYRQSRRQTPQHSLATLEVSSRVDLNQAF